MEKEHWIVERFKSLIGEGRRFATENEMALFLGLAKTNVSKFYNFLKGTDTQYSAVFDWIEKLSGIDEGGAIMPVMRGVGANAPEIIVEGDVVMAPVVGAVGAGPGQFNADLTPIGSIPILRRFIHPDLFICEVKGDSMEPVIMDGGFVGAIPLTQVPRDGGIYIIYDEELGATAKYIYHGDNGKLILRSENPKAPERELDARGYEKAVVGEVLWIWHSIGKAAL